MKDTKNKEPDVNVIGTPLAEFVHYYNGNIPDGYPRASRKALEEFRERYPALFKAGDEWTIERHRKKLMDWLSSYQETE